MLITTLFLCAVIFSAQAATYPKSDHYDGQHFSNPGDASNVKGLWQVLKWKMTSTVTKWPEWVENEIASSAQIDLPEKEFFSSTYINHATHLLQFRGLNILTDPVYSKRVSPFTFAGPARHRPPGVAFDDLPRIDVVLISHSHYDHMDKVTIRRLAEKFDPLFVVPLGNGRLIAQFGANKIEELDWYQSLNTHDAKISLVPAQHWSSRTPFDRNVALWGGFVVEKDERKVYFAGDTGYGPHFKDIYAKFGPVDYAILPIGAYEPRWFMSEQHMNPDDAVKAHLDLHSRKSIGTHFGTFQLTDEGIDDPPKHLREALLAHQVREDAFVVPRPGGKTP